MTDIFFELYIFLQVVNYTVDLNSCVAALFIRRKLLYELTLFAADYGSLDYDFTARRQEHYFIGNFVHRLTADFTPALRTVRNTDARKQKTEIIVNFRYRSNRRARVVRRCFLVD